MYAGKSTDEIYDLSNTITQISSGTYKSKFSVNPCSTK